jgi:hypothetical protein
VSSALELEVLGSSRFARNGKPVAQMALSGARPDTRIGAPSLVAPPPARAAYTLPSMGARITPTTGTPAATSATDTPTTGKPCTKFAVPSSGSTNQPTSASRSPPDSSPKNASSGAAACSTAPPARRVSASLTQSPGAFSRTLLRPECVEHHGARLRPTRQRGRERPSRSRSGVLTRRPSAPRAARACRGEQLATHRLVGERALGPASTTVARPPDTRATHRE